MAFTISPVAKQQFLDSSGNPLVGGKLYTYAAGTTNPQATYSDSVGTPNTNPIILDSSGECTIFLATLSYKFSLQDANGVPLWTVDNIANIAPPPAGGAVTSDDQTIAFSATPAFVGAGQIELFRITLTGNVTGSTLSMAGIPTPALITFEITQDGVGGRTFVWPANVLGAMVISATATQRNTQIFLWDGANAVALGPGVFT